MYTAQHGLRHNTIIVGKHFIPSSPDPRFTPFLLVFGASGDLAKKKVGTTGILIPLRRSHF